MRKKITLIAIIVLIGIVFLANYQTIIINWIATNWILLSIFTGIILLFNELMKTIPHKR